jgi:hypothetical protein
MTLKILDYKFETPNSRFNYPKLRLRRRVGLFNLSLGCFGFCNPRLFKSWDYLNVSAPCGSIDHDIRYTYKIRFFISKSDL